MKTKDKKVKEFDTVETFREIKEKISKDIYGMTFNQFKTYMAERKQKPQA